MDGTFIARLKTCGHYQSLKFAYQVKLLLLSEVYKIAMCRGRFARRFGVTVRVAAGRVSMAALAVRVTARARLLIHREGDQLAVGVSHRHGMGYHVVSEQRV